MIQYQNLMRVMVVLGTLVVVACGWGIDASGATQPSADDLIPALATLRQFFDPPFLNHWAFSIATIMIAVVSLPAIGAFQGTPKLFVSLISFYCWGRIVMMLVSAYLVGRGALSP